MEWYVSATQAKVWCDHKVLPIVKAVKTASDEELPEVLAHAVLTGGLWGNFLPMPFVADSPEGERLTTAWEQVKAEYPNRAMIQEFVWKFWNPEIDARDARFTNEQPMLASIAIAAAMTAAGVSA